MDISALPLLWLLAIFALCAIVILFAGSRLAVVADQIADQTGFGEALTGAVLLGAATSLPGVLTSVYTAWNGLPSLAYSNAVGGIAAQSLFLVIADFRIRRVNLEHAAASITNIVNGMLLIVLLALMMTAAAGPEISIMGIHPVSVLCFGIYIGGLLFAKSAHETPMWHAKQTPQTRRDEAETENTDKPLSKTLPVFLICLALVAGAGYGVAESASALVTNFAIPQSVVGALLTSVVTSLPELVTTLAAVRHKAYQLAVGGIIGGNAFDTLFASFADVAYREGSIYHAIAPADLFLTAVVVTITAVFVMGLIRRERRGVGFEAWGVLLLYAMAVAGVLAMT